MDCATMAQDIRYFMHGLVGPTSSMALVSDSRGSRTHVISLKPETAT